MATTTTRLALRKPDSDPVTGDNVDVDLDLNANSDKVDNAVGAFPCTSGTRPGSPWHGQIIRETDTGRLFVRNATNSTWDQIFAARGTISLAPAGVGAANANMRWDLASGSILTSYFVGAKQAADANYRYGIAYDGFTEWGPGSGAADVNLYRGGTNALYTDDMFRANGVTMDGSSNLISNYAMTSGTDTRNVNTYANMAGTGSVTSVALTKKYSSTFSQLRVRMWGSLYVTGAAGQMDYAVLTNATDYQVGTLYINTVSDHQQFYSERYITGLPAAAYTLQARWKRLAGTGVLTRAPDDWLGISVEEVSV